MAEKQKKRGSAFTAIVIVVLLTIVAVELVRIQDKIAVAQAEQAGVEDQLAAQKQENASLEAALEKTNDPSYLQELARSELGYVTPGEKDFYDVASK